MVLSFTLLLLLASCGTGEGFSSPTKPQSVTQKIGHPKIEDISWEFRNSVRYQNPVAVFDYTNNSNYTIVQLYLQFKFKDGVTSDQLQLTDTLTDALVSDDKIPELSPYVIDWIVCDPGEQAQGAPIYLIYNTEPTNATQCELMNLISVEIEYIAEDGKIHTVFYSAENQGYSLSSKAKEPYVWIDNDYTKMIPKPTTRVVIADQYEETTLCVDVYDITHATYLAYISECQDVGFVDKYPGEDHDYSFFGTNAGGYQIYVRYLEYMHLMEITLKMIDAE